MPAAEPLKHARALLEFIRIECPDLIGAYILQPDLNRAYRELCEKEGWRPRHWTAIARHLEQTDGKDQCEARGPSVRRLQDTKILRLNSFLRFLR